MPRDPIDKAAMLSEMAMWSTVKSEANGFGALDVSKFSMDIKAAPALSHATNTPEVVSVTFSAFP